MKSLQHAIEAARVAVLERGGGLPNGEGTSGTRSLIDDIHAPKYNLHDTTIISPAQGHRGLRQGAIVSLDDPAPEKILRRVRGATERPREAPLPCVLATFQGAETIAQGVKLSKGARRLWTLLHRLAVDVARERAYTVAPTQVTFHVPAVSLAGVLEYHADHVARLGRELERAGLLDFGGHAQTVLGRSMWDGCLWAVKTRREAEPPRVRGDEWRANWRPDFQADVEGHTGAAAEMSGLLAQRVEIEDRYRVVKHRAAVFFGHRPPAVSSSDNSSPAGLRAVSEAIGGIWSTHARCRARRVGQLASALCTALGEPDRRRYWCASLWSAFRATVEGCAGLQGLAAQVARLAGDLEEDAPWRNPGAVLAARLKGANV